MNSLKDIATVVKGHNYDLVVKSLEDKNKNLTEALSKLAKYANQYANGDGGIGQLDEAIEEANDTLIGNSIILIDFPTYLKKKYPDTGARKAIIDIYNEWNK